MKHKLNDKVKITAQKSGHSIPVGEVVTIDAILGDLYSTFYSPYKGSFTEEECELIANPKISLGDRVRIHTGQQGIIIEVDTDFSCYLPYKVKLDNAGVVWLDDKRLILIDK